MGGITQTVDLCRRLDGGIVGHRPTGSTSLEGVSTVWVMPPILLPRGTRMSFLTSGRGPERDGIRELRG